MAIYLHPGQIEVGKKGDKITTILGSCVSVAIWDPVAHLGGINHFLLPTSGGGVDQATPKYGDIALPQLLEKTLALGGQRNRLQAKVFGGASISGAQHQSMTLGDKNVQQALDFLKHESIPVVAQSTGGCQGRKLIFDLGDGVVWVKVLGGQP